jgi:acyl dehydratase
MPIKYDEVMALRETKRVVYEDRETILYALAVGFGRNPLDESELPFVYENPALRTVPTMTSVLGGGIEIILRSGINFLMMVHGEQRTTLHRPLPPRGVINSTSRFAACIDKGEGKGALLLVESELRDAGGTHLATVSSTAFARGDGGFGGPRDGAPQVHAIPNREADQIVEAETRADQALLYRLLGDRNPLHADPAVAANGGFPRPILHGLCIYGTVCRQILQHGCDYDPTRLRAFDARFSNPMFPGETIVIELWRDGNVLSFRATSKERGQIVLNNGRALIE